ncbi:hypothetical protein [Alloprevotella tannerae]
MKKFYNPTFSTLLLLCGLMVSFIACSNDGGDDPDGPQLKGDSILVSLTQASRAKVGQDLNSLLVGDTIFYNLVIEDPKAPAEADYTIDLIGVGSSSHHRRLNQDFKLLIGKVGEGDTVKDWQQINEFPYTIPTPGKYLLKYVTKMHGTFIHNYIFQRRVNKKPNSKITHQFIGFNVLFIEMWYEDCTVRKPGGGSHSVHRNDFYFRIKCGDFATDKLFEKPNRPNSPNDRTYSFEIRYDNNEYKGTFQGGEPRCFFEGPQKKIKAPEVENLTVSSLVINIYTGDNTAPTIFHYKNLKLENRRPDAPKKKQQNNEKYEIIR